MLVVEFPCWLSDKIESIVINASKYFFGYKRSDNITQVLFELGLPSFNRPTLISTVVLF